MATFSHLPNEMVTKIWEYFLDPQDVQSFALVSKRIYATGAPFVDEHNKLKRKYSFSNPVVCEGDASVLLLKKILLWPPVALYVTHLSTDQYWPGWRPERGISYSYYTPCSDDDMELFTEAIRGALVLQNEVEDWITAIKEGNDDPIVALLLSFLPNLCTMTLVVHTGFCRLAKTLRRISETKNSAFLTRLTTVNLEVQVLSEDIFMDWEWLSTSAAFPFVQSLNVVRTDVDDRDLLRYRQCFEPGSSTAERLALAKSGNCPKSMFHLFQSFKGLKNFTYFNKDESAEPFEPYWMGNAIVVYAKHSLESLKITSEWKDYTKPTTLGSFRDCTNLREMEINVDLFRGKSSFHTLPDLFPISIEKIHLHRGADGCFNRIERSTIANFTPAIVEAFVRAKSKLLPSLRVLTIKYEPGTFLWEHNKASITAWEKKCRNVGIELSVFELKGLGWQRV